jgi:hypothetical protein
MRDQVWYVAVLISIMCLVRLLMGAAGYINPDWLMEQFNISIDVNLQMPYIIRVWAARDVVLAILVVFSNKSTVSSLLLACIAMDTADILSARLSGAAGLFDLAETQSLQLAAIAALIPESAAIALIRYHSLRAKRESP